MPISDYLKRLRAKVGNDLLLVPSVTAATFDDDGRLLLVRHTHEGVWVAPGGSLDPGETPADAVVREVWEETGLWVEPTALLGVYSGPDFRVNYANGDQVIYVMSLFECRVIQGQPRPDGVETLEIGYFSETEAWRLKLPAWMRVVLPDVFKRGNTPLFSAPVWQPPGVR